MTLVRVKSEGVFCRLVGEFLVRSVYIRQARTPCCVFGRPTKQQHCEVHGSKTGGKRVKI